MISEHQLRGIILDTIWMARRYANGRSTYAPGVVNRCIDLLLNSGINIEPDPEFGMYAADGMFGKWNPELRRFEKEFLK